MAEVRFSRKALADLRTIRDWLGERNPEVAARVVSAIEQSVGLLGEFPKLGRAAPNGHGRIHVVPRFGYVISYRVSGDVVEILYVFHPSRSR